VSGVKGHSSQARELMCLFCGVGNLEQKFCVKKWEFANKNFCGMQILLCKLFNNYFLM
jgi:hypothetical protein